MTQKPRRLFTDEQKAEAVRMDATSKGYKKRNASGAVYDDPRVTVGPGVLTKLER